MNQSNNETGNQDTLSTESKQPDDSSSNMKSPPAIQDIPTVVVPDVRPNNARSREKGLYMDDAISKTKFGLFNYIMIFECALILNAVIMETCGMGSVIPVSQCDLELTANQKGMLAGVSYFGIICSSHMWGFLADTKGRRRVIQPTLLLAFLMSVASSFAPNFYIFLALRFLNGFFISGGSATVYAYLSEFHDNTYRARAILGSSVLIAMSCILLPVVAWGIINQEWEFAVPLINITYKPWRFYLVVCSLPAFFACIIITFLPESPKFVLGQGKQNETFAILQTMNRVNNGKNAELELFEIYEETESIENRKRIADSKNSRFPFLSSVWIQTAPLFMPPYLFPTALICFIQFCIYQTSNGFFMFFQDILNRMANNLKDSPDLEIKMCDLINLKPIQLNDTIDNITEEVCMSKLELDALEQGLLLEVLYACSLALVGILVNHVGKFPMVFVALLSAGSCGIFCMITTNPMIQKYAFTFLLLACVGPNIVNTATVEVYPTALRGMAVCISLMFGRLGSVVGSNVVALLIDNHCEAVFYLSGSTVIGAGILTFFIPKIHQKIPKHKKIKDESGNYA